MKKFYLLILCFIFILGCTPKGENNKSKKQTTDDIDLYSFRELLFDDNFPKLYFSNKDDFIEYFKKTGRPKWLQYPYSDNEAMSHFFIIEESQSLFYKKHIESISITDEQKEYFPNISLREGIKIAEQFLPTKLPPIREEYSIYPNKNIVFNCILEAIYFLPGEKSLGTVNEIIYTSKYESDVHEPVLPEGREGATPYYNAIRIIINEAGINTISIGGMQYSPPRLQESYKLNINVIDNYDDIKDIIKYGKEFEKLKNYIEY